MLINYSKVAMAGFITITIINLGVQLLNKSGRRAKLPHRHYLDLSPVEEEEDNDQGALSNSPWEGDLQGPLRREDDDDAGFPNAGRTTRPPFLTK